VEGSKGRRKKGGDAEKPYTKNRRHKTVVKLEPCRRVHAPEVPRAGINREGVNINE
jgi:hypothetical protein